MEVEPRYKRTELGTFPNDWQVFMLSEHFKIYAGGDVPGHSLSPTQSDLYRYPIFANSLQNRGLYGYTSEWRSCAGSLTITARGHVGHAEYRSDAFFPIVRLLVLEPIGKLDAQFTTYVVNDRVDFAVESTGVPQLTAPHVGKHLVASPPTLDEQRAIAAALNDVDGLLDGLDRLIEKKRKVKQATMQQLLTGQTRLAGFRGEWITKKLGQVGHCFRGVTYSPSSHLVPHDTDRTIRLLRSNNIQDATVVTSDIYFVDSARVSPNQVLRIHDIVICRANGSKDLVGKAGLFLVDDGNDYTFSALMECFRTDPGIANPAFVYGMFQTRRYRKYVNNLLVGSCINHLRSSDVESFEFPFPPLAEQEAIGIIFSDLDAELGALNERRNKTAALKQAMMQELLTGKTRLVGRGAIHG